MKSPELYTILKLDMFNFIHFEKDENNNKIHTFNRDIQLNSNQIQHNEIKQQFNHLFRIIKNNKQINNNKIDDVIFIDCHRHKNYPQELDGILRYGVSINGVVYKYWGKSASMSRNGILGLVSEEMYDLVEQYAMMEIQFEKTVLSKFEAYKCLLLSSCFTIEEELPYMIVVDDYDTVVKDVHIKYVDEQELEYIDKDTGKIKLFKEKVIKEGTKDIGITTNDGSGLCTIEIAKHWAEYLNLDYVPCASMLRVPYIKGLAIAVDFKGYYKEHSITEITDIWGHKHKVDDIDIILTKSQFKGYKYFKVNGDYSDWERYLGLLKKYNYCIGIAKMNYSHKDEPKMTRCNYQTLQTLDITTEELIDVSQYTREWIERVLNGDLLYTYKYLGISENTEPMNDYMKAILYNPQMVHDAQVKNYLIKLMENTINEMKIGKIYIKGAFKIMIPDVIQMLQYIGGMKPVGCLKAGEMYAKEHKGKYLLNRNPHLSRSEHVILNAVINDEIAKWLSHLEGICMFNGYDVSAPRLNGADFDGDLVLVHNNKKLMKGVDNNLPIVLDIEDKITAKELPYTLEHIIQFTKASLDSRIGEISNCGTSYVNKYTKTEEKKKLYDDYCCLLSVINGKEID